MPARQSADSGIPVGAKTALTNVRVFDGTGLRPPGTVVIDGGLIGTDPGGGQVVDGRGGVLLPGLIDAHVHLSGVETLERLSAFGVTTALDMGTWPAPTPTPRQVSPRRRRSATACTASWNSWSTPGYRLLTRSGPRRCCLPGISGSPTAASSSRESEPTSCCWPVTRSPISARRGGLSRCGVRAWSGCRPDRRTPTLSPGRADRQLSRPLIVTSD
jgi:hypothetical protein